MMRTLAVDKAVYNEDAFRFDWPTLQSIRQLALDLKELINELGAIYFPPQHEDCQLNDV
jgi:hypothetical protein